MEIDNNLIGNAIRPTKLGTRNWMFIGRGHAGEKSAIIYNVVENCRRLGIDAREYLEDVLPGMTNQDAIKPLTPEGWLQAKRARGARRHSDATTG